MSSFKYQIDIFKRSHGSLPNLAITSTCLSAGAPTSRPMSSTASSSPAPAPCWCWASARRPPIGCMATRWPNWLMLAVLGSLLLFYMIPVMTLVGPWYLIFRELGLYNTRMALILTPCHDQPADDDLAAAGVFPRASERAGRGGADRRLPPRPGFPAGRLAAGPFQGLIAAGVLAFVFSWNEFPIALTLTTHATATVPVGIAGSHSNSNPAPPGSAAASIVATTAVL